MKRDFESARERPAYSLAPEEVVEPPLNQKDWIDLHRGAELFNSSEYWESHEAWEEVWRRCDVPSRVFFQALIQLAAAYYQLGRGVYHGVVKHFNNAGAKLEQFPDDFLGVDIGLVKKRIDEGRERARQAGPDGLEGVEWPPVPTISFRKPKGPFAWTEGPL